MRNITKLAGVAGIIWASTNAVLGFSTGQPPELDASGADIATYLSEHRGVYLTAVAVFGATLPLLIVFVGELIRRVRTSAEGTASSVMNHAVVVLLVGTVLAYTLLTPFVLGDGLGDDASTGTLRYAYILTFVGSLIGNIGGAVLIAAASVAQSPGRRTASRVVAVVVGAVCVGGLVNPTLAMIGGLGFIAIAVWVVAVGFGMVREPVGMAQSAFAAA